MLKIRFLIIFGFWSIQLQNSFSQVTSIDTAQAINAVDYYSGRLIPGIGFGFQQYLDEKLKGDQTLSFTPFLYFQMRPSLAFNVSNETSVRKVGTYEDIQYNNNPIGNRTFIQCQWRPISSLQLYPYARIYGIRDTYNSHFSGNRHEEIDTKEQHYGIIGHYLSKQGCIYPSRDRLKWMYYADSTLVLLDPQQMMVTFEISGENNKVEDTGWDMEVETELPFLISTEKFEQFQGKTELNYGLGNSIWSQLQAKFIHEEIRDLESSESIKNENQSDVMRWGGGPILLHQLGQNFFQKFNAQFIRTQVDFNRIIKNNLFENIPPISSSYHMTFQNLSIDYSVSRFNQVKGVNQEQFLSNYQGLLGNQLNPHGMIIHLMTQFDREKIQPVSPELLNVPIDTRKDIEVLAQNFKIAGRIRYGVFRYIECQFQTLYENQGILQPNFLDPGDDENKWYPNNTWSNTFGFSFINYYYNRFWKSHYGWDQLSPIDQLYGALLSPGMVRSKINVTLISWCQQKEGFSFLGANDLIKQYSLALPDYVNNLKWQFHVDLEAGLPLGFVLSCGAVNNQYSSKMRNADDADWKFMITLNWQPWHSLRFTLQQLSWRQVQGIYTIPDAPPYEEYLTNMQTRNAWMIRVAGLW